MLRYPRPAPLPLILLILAAPAGLRAQVAPGDSSDLLQASQALVDAVTAGDSTVWARYLAPEWFQSDEEAEPITRKEVWMLAGA